MREKGNQTESHIEDGTLLPPPDALEQEAPAEEPNDDAKQSQPDPRDQEIRELRKQLRASAKRIRELEESERAWAERARRLSAEEKPHEEEAAADEDLDVIEALTSDGAKGLDKILRKLGYARVEDVEQRIEQTRAHMTRDAKLIARYPDLADENSDFFRATAQRYQELVKNPALRDSGMLLELAAELAEGDLALRRRQARGGRDFGLDDDESEEERVERVRAQAGSRGRRAAEQTPDDDELTPLQKRIAARFGISEDAYRKRARQGVQISGLPRR